MDWDERDQPFFYKIESSIESERKKMCLEHSKIENPTFCVSDSKRMQENAQVSMITDQDAPELEKKSGKQWRFVAVTFMVILFGICLWQVFSASVPRAYISRAEEKTARDVVLGIVEIKDFHTLTLKFERGGIVLTDQIQVGKEVKRGDILMELDTEELELEMDLLQIEKAFDEEESKLPREDAFDLRRAEQILRIQTEKLEQGRQTQDAVKDFERNLAAFESAHERIVLKEELDRKVRTNDIEKVQYSLDHMEMKSPIDGTIVEVLARKGDLVYQSQPVIRMIDDRRLMVGLISEDDYDKVKVGYPVEISLAAYPNTVFKGEIEQILPMSDSETRKFEVYIKADIAPAKLIPGLTGEIVVIADEHKNAVVVPSQAVYEGYVLKVEGNKIRKVPVETGFVSLMEIEILSGIDAGDIIVTESNNLYEDGQLVRTQWE